MLHEHKRNIIEEIKKLPIESRMDIATQTLKSIEVHDYREQMETAADILYDDYKNDKELTAFTNVAS